MNGRCRESGYVLFGIVIVLVILGIFMVAAVPLWQKVMQREREQELIWRGYQYMQAIERYQRKFPGAYPPKVDILVQQKFLRKAYKDPMTAKGEWRVLRQLSPELQIGQQQQQQEAGRAAGINDRNRSQAKLRPPGGAASPQDPTKQLTGGRFQSSLGRSASDESMGGIVGVASSSTEKTFYKVSGKEKYKDWLFVWGAQQQQPTVVPIQPGQSQKANPFPGLPPPPSLTAFGFGGAPVVPGQPGQQPTSGQLGLPGPQNPSGAPGGFPGQGGQPGFGTGGTPRFGPQPGPPPQPRRPKPN